ncbi:acyl-CoA N-acyltransferase [Hypoxylon crocopeplum]|nr:acyl-CoA N-acyltransferase [Hypoxylon crocopeplum]
MATIRLRTDQDITACLQILNIVHETNGYPVGGVGDPALYFTKDDAAWVAEVGGIVAGHIALAKAHASNVAVALWWQQHPEDINVAVLGRLFVHPRNRKGGTATRLIDTAVEEARARGQRLLMFALVKDQDAIRLYRMLGWRYFGSTVFRWGENEMAAECFASPVP